MGWRHVSGFWSGRWANEGRKIPAVITSVYVLCGLLWMFVSEWIFRHGIADHIEDAVYILASGVVSYKTRKVRKFDGNLRATTYVNVTSKK